SEEQKLFARLGVFVGGCTYQAVEAVCGDTLNIQIAEGLESLLLKNLTQRQILPDGESRFMMLETMREYAIEKLIEQHELATVQAKHARYFRSMTDKVAQVAYGSQEVQWLDRLELEHDNLRAMLDWYLDYDVTAQISLQIIANLARFWELKGHLAEGRNWFERARSLPDANQSSKPHADALLGIGDIAYIQCDYTRTHELYTSALKIYRELGDELGVAHALLGLGEVATEVGDYNIAPELFEEAYTIMKRFNSTSGCARALTQLGWGALRVGELDVAHLHLKQGLEAYQMIDDQVGIALTNSGLGEIAIRNDDYDAAIEFLEASLHLRRQLGQKWGIAASLGSLAWVAIKQQELNHATSLLLQSLQIRYEIGDAGGIAWCLEKFAEISTLLENSEHAVCILGCA
ncbi:MAG: hypothetical protein CUN55_15590, partial [Phototrophicales bacterium]